MGLWVFIVQSLFMDFKGGVVLYYVSEILLLLLYCYLSKGTF